MIMMMMMMMMMVMTPDQYQAINGLRATLHLLTFLATSALYSLNYNFSECRMGKATTPFQTTTSRKSIQKCKIQQRNRGLNKPMALDKYGYGQALTYNEIVEKQGTRISYERTQRQMENSVVRDEEFSCIKFLLVMGNGYILKISNGKNHEFYHRAATSLPKGDNALRLWRPRKGTMDYELLKLCKIVVGHRYK
uniref:Uncharacterized protein n=1 Tax=Glossina pallidipes TaxID=7398 RepID=A0A1B0A6M8_GLOPL